MRNLKGSEKQVAWAQDIINNAINTVNANIKLASESEQIAALKGLNSWLEIKDMITRAFDSVDDAKTIIENRRKFDPSRILRIHSDMEFKKRRA